jgi:hypothetical protein
MIDCWPLSKINQLASTRTCTSWSMNVVSILLPSPLHQQLKTRPISHHPLATHSHSRNRNRPNHLVLRPISNHPLTILYTFKIRSHSSSSILIPSPPHQQLKTRPISYHPLATHTHSRNRSHPNHRMLHPMILHIFKTRSHTSRSILIPSPPHQQLKNHPISYHPLATYSHSRNTSHPNHLVLCPMILYTFKIRSHASSSILPHQQLKISPISHHPLATHINSRNRSNLNHPVLRPIANHILMILYIFKIRSHPSSSNNGYRKHNTTMKSPCEYAKC